MKVGRREAIAALLGVALVVAAFVVPHLGLGIVTPLIHSTPLPFSTGVNENGAPADMP